jgi:formiminotetrahydrofolate cyclodeaminase
LDFYHGLLADDTVTRGGGSMSTFATHAARAIVMMHDADRLGETVR